VCSKTVLVQPSFDQQRSKVDLIMDFECMPSCLCADAVHIVCACSLCACICYSCIAVHCNEVVMRACTPLLGARPHELVT